MGFAAEKLLQNKEPTRTDMDKWVVRSRQLVNNAL